MKRSEQETLLKEILGSEETAAIREASLQAGLASLRNRQKHQRSIRLSAFAVLVFMIAAGWVLHRPPPRSTSIELSNRGATSDLLPLFARDERGEGRGEEKPNKDGPPTGAQIRFISDEELFALFPGRPVALIGKPGEQQLVFLDAPKKAPQEKL